MLEEKCIKICIDGPDKTGKETQSKLLAKNLEKEGLLVKRLEVPIQDEVFYPKIYEMLRDGTAVKYPEIFQTFQAANRMLWQRNNWHILKLSFDVVIFDRWDVSSWAYGQASNLSIEFLSVCLFSIEEVDFYYIFDGPPFPTPERDDDSYEKDKEFMERVRFFYQQWHRLNPEITKSKLIDANRDVKVIEKELLEDFKLRFIPTGQPVA